MRKCKPFRAEQKSDAKIHLRADDPERARAQHEAMCSLKDLVARGVTRQPRYDYTIHTGIQWVHSFKVPNLSGEGHSFIGIAASDKWSPRAGRPRLRIIVGGMEGNA